MTNMTDKEQDEIKIQFSHGYGNGNYAQAYECVSIRRLQEQPSERASASVARDDPEDDKEIYETAWLSGFYCGFFSSYEDYEVPGGQQQHLEDAQEFARKFECDL